MFLAFLSRENALAKEVKGLKTRNLPLSIELNVSRVGRKKDLTHRNTAEAILRYVLIPLTKLSFL